MVQQVEKHPVESVTFERLLTDKQVAERLSCGRSTVWKWTRCIKDFPKPVHLVGKSRFKESEVNRYINSLARTTLKK